jgi:hypothetical protein
MAQRKRVVGDFFRRIFLFKFLKVGVIFFEKQLLLNKINTGEIMDGKTIMLLQYAQIHGFFV